MAETKPWAIGMVVVCTVFTSIGSILIKTGVDRFQPTYDGILQAYPFIIGLFFYFLGFVLLTISFRHGELSVLFPFVSLSFVWVAIFSYFFLSETIAPIEMAGVAVIVSGVALIGTSGKNNRRLRLRH